MPSEPTSREILEAVHANQARVDEVFEIVRELAESMHVFSESVDERFDQVEERFKEVDRRFDLMDDKVAGLSVKMVTKDYLDNKIADLRGYLVILARKGNTKLSVLVDGLVTRKVLDEATAKQILALEPFPTP